jgi:hypothetical protein
MQESGKVPPVEHDALNQAIEAFRGYCVVVLFSFAKHCQGLRETIARNFIARGMICTQSIFSVWKNGSEQDAWILFRSLLDRLLHLRYLAETDGFTDFDDYSFQSMYESRHQLISDPDMKNKAPDNLKELQKVNKARYEVVAAKQPPWRRPKPREVAEKMGLGFLYRSGYNYASMHTHPMSDDGEADFTRLTTRPRTMSLPDSTVVRNSILIHTMLVQEALNISKMRWHAILYDFLGHVRLFLDNGDEQFLMTMRKIGQAWPDFQFCKGPASTDVR